MMRSIAFTVVAVALWTATTHAPTDRDGNSPYSDPTLPLHPRLVDAITKFVGQ